jgi:anaerobic magnesium-protoporphyrin IX monomethyl ester cyclase
MRVTLLYPVWTGDYGLFGHFARRASVWPPTNLALLAAVAEQYGHDVTIIDGEVERLSQDQLVDRALATNPDLIGLTAYSPFFHLNVELATALKSRAPQIPIAIGGPHITIMKEKAFMPPFDYLFVGEAETSFPKFLDTYESGRDVTGVQGLIFRQNGVINTGDPEPISLESTTGKTLGKHYPLDQFPFPARHLLPMAKYKMGGMHGRLNFTSIQTMRGCPWKCIFCASEALNTTRVIMRSPASVVAEMKSVVEDFGIKHFYIVDDVMTLWPEHILEICDGIERENLNITFEGGTRANLVEDKLFARLSECGLMRISFGLETVDTEMRKTMKKKVPLEAYTKANKICDKYGVEALNSVMIGLPGETRESVRETLRWLRNAREVKQANFAIAMPYPGTEFADIAAAGTHGVELISNDYSDYRRYGSAVTRVGELEPEDLIELQNEGFVSIYSAWWRWYPVWKKHGIMGLMLQLLRLGRMWRRNVMRAAKPLRVHPNLS